MVEDANRTVVALGDILSDSVYYLIEKESDCTSYRGKENCVEFHNIFVQVFQNSVDESIWLKI